MVSAPPPAPKPMITCTGRDGQACAPARAEASTKGAASAIFKVSRRRMSGIGFLCWLISAAGTRPQSREERKRGVNNGRLIGALRPPHVLQEEVMGRYC